MSTVINLRQVRKSRARSDKRAAGDANAAKFGEAKSLRAARQAEEARTGRVLDAHRQDEAPEPPRRDD